MPKYFVQGSYTDQPLEPVRQTISLLLAKSAFRRAISHVLVQSMPPAGARCLCPVCQSA